jgi:molecular chaperone DnaK
LDNQSFVPVHVLQGEREMAADNRSLASFELTGIPPAPRGVPKIQVLFRVDADGILQVEATDLGTNRSHAIRVTSNSGLTKGEIDRLVEEGEKFKETDELRRQLAETKNQAETLLYTSEQALDGYADLLSEEARLAIRNDIDILREALDSGAGPQEIREAYDCLTAATFAIAEEMYSKAGSTSSDENS